MQPRCEEVVGGLENSMGTTPARRGSPSRWKTSKTTKSWRGRKVGHTGACQEASLEEVAGGGPRQSPLLQDGEGPLLFSQSRATPSEGRITPVLRASVLGDASSPPEASVRALGALACPASVVDVC